MVSEVKTERVGNKTIRFNEFRCDTGFARNATEEDDPLIVPCEPTGWEGKTIFECVEGWLLVFVIIRWFDALI